jgi:hypothetical protein
MMMGAAVQGMNQAEYSNILDAWLYLLSEISADNITRHGLRTLLLQETTLREAQLFKLLSQLHRSVMSIGAANKWKWTDARGQGPNTKAQTRINTLQNKQTFVLQFYNACVNVLTKLDSGPRFQ